MSGLNVPLTPLRFLERAAEVAPAKTAIIDGDREWTYEQFAAAVQQLAKSLIAQGISDGTRVAYLATNSAELLMAHYAVPLTRGVLVAINTRLSAKEVQYILEHSGARLVFGDADLLRPVVNSGLHFTTVDGWVQLPDVSGHSEAGAGSVSYDSFLTNARGGDLLWDVDDENRTVAINYTSGTTGRPKGVMYSHRGAYLNSLSNIHHSRFDRDTRYLWTLPMFHCNGWCTTWAVTAALGTHICYRAVRADTMWGLIDDYDVTHMNGAPTVLTLFANADRAHPLATPLTISNGGAPPSPTIIARIRALGATLVHIYGLTETYGPYSLCEPKSEWSTLDPKAQATLMARQGVGMLTSERMRVVRSKLSSAGELVDVAADGKEMGEIVMRGNTVMKGYYNDEAATQAATFGGWFHSGDLGVMHPDGYVQLLDRAKDVVVSGGENISTIEVEQAILSHPAVQDAAVVGTPDDKWGERPKAFVITYTGTEVNETSIIAHVKTQIASYKAPSSVEFVDNLPRTSTGKIRKNELREAEWASSTIRIQG
ncbi:AMP-binding protein [Rhodococcus fascians]|nr:AMP-binding protein [Rhodococcus fascians]MBY4417862.1 AMP-binding protein [Rhodococcus fascians]